MSDETKSVPPKKTLSDNDIQTKRSYGRRTILTLFGSGIVGVGAVAAGVRRASADPIAGDADQWSDVVNPDPRPDADREAPPSDAKDSDQSSSGDAGDQDVRTFADPKTQSDSPDSDGSFADAKDVDRPTSADHKDSD